MVNKKKQTLPQKVSEFQVRARLFTKNTDIVTACVEEFGPIRTREISTLCRAVIRLEDAIAKYWSDRKVSPKTGKSKTGSSRDEDVDAQIIYGVRILILDAVARARKGERIIRSSGGWATNNSEWVIPLKPKGVTNGKKSR